jgi:hypothetical protein
MGTWTSKAAWASVAIGGLIGSSVASAAIPDSDGTIHGCVSETTGLVRVVDTAKPGHLGSCNTTGPRLLREAAVTWNQTGLAGPPGPPGPPGEPGLGAVSHRSAHYPALEIPAAGQVVDVYVWCEPGERVIVGYYGGLPTGAHVAGEGPEIAQTRQGWSFSLSSATGDTLLADFSARATCVT